MYRKMTFKIIIIALAILLSLSTLSGCSSKQSTSKNTKTIAITDFSGTEIKVKQPVQKIVSMYGLATQTLFLMGEGDKVFGSTKMAVNDAFIKLAYPGASKKMKLVISPNGSNVEEIAKINPDLVIAAFWNSEQVKKQLGDLKIPIITLNMETPKNYIKSIEILSKILNDEQRARSIIDYYDENMQKILKKTNTIKNKPKVMLVEYSMRSKSLKVPGKEYFQNTIINMAGGESVSNTLPGGWNIVNVEQVAKWDPDIIITVSYSLKYTSEDLKKTIMNDVAWKNIRAVKSGKVYAMPNDGESWDYPAPKWILGLYWMAKTIHPEIFGSLNVKEEAANFYKKFYNLDIDKIKIVGDLN